MAKAKTVIIRLVSEANTGTFYTVRKNPKLGKKLRFRKYDAKTRKHEWFEEKKIK